MTANRNGFSLLELLAVLALATLLAGLLAAGIGAARRHAKRTRAQTDLAALRLALDDFRAERGAYPKPAPDRTLSALPAFSNLARRIDRLPTRDPWKRPYRYDRVDRFRCRLWSEGPDPDSPLDDVEEGPPKQAER